MRDLIELEPRPARPDLPGTVVIRDAADGVIDAIAADLMLHAMNCVRAFGDFHLALSGGSTPLPLYQRLMIDPRYREFPWARTHLWIVDERRVPQDDERSNFKHIHEILGEHSGMPRSHIHPIMATRDDADAAYEEELRQTLAWREKGQDRLDFVLLGMGADAHTASLFPNSAALRADGEGARSARLVRINAGPEVTPPDRVTMTLHLINASRFIAVMVTGEGKRETIARLEGATKSGVDRDTIMAMPILGVRPLGGELRWFLDFDACPGPRT